MYFDSSYFSSHTSVPLPSFLSLSLFLLSIMRFVTEKSLFSLSQTIQNLREKVNAAAESASRQSELIEATVAKTRSLDAERSELEGRVRKMEAQLTDCELAKERSRRDKQTVDNIPKTIFLLFLSLSANSAYISLSLSYFSSSRFWTG